MLTELSNSSKSYIKKGNKRVFVDRKVYEQSESIRSIPSIKGEDIPRFVENPEAYIPENIDISLELFGERVRDLGIRVYRAQPFVNAQQNKNGWFDFDIGFHVKNDEGDIVNQLDENHFIGEESEFVQLNKDEYVRVPFNASEFAKAS